MPFELELATWLDLAQNWVYSFVHFLRNGAGYSTGHEMFRFIALPVVWLLFFTHALLQASALHKHNSLITKPAQYPELPFVSGVMWAIPVWVPYAWMEPTRGLYLIPVVAFLTHLVMWFSGMFRLRTSPLHVYFAVASMALSSYLMLGHISVPYKRGLPQEAVVMQSPSSEVVAKMLMNRCFEDEGCVNKPDMAARVAARQMQLDISPLTMALITNRCTVVGHSPLGIFECADGQETSIREMLGRLYPDSPSAAANCHRVDWQLAAWQPNGYWPHNPPLTILAAKEETLLNCASNKGLGGKPFVEGATPDKLGRYLLPAKYVIHHDWWAAKLRWAEAVVNAPGVED